MIKDEMADQVEELLDKVPLYPAPPHGSHESSFGQTASQGSCSSNLDAEFINASSEIYNQHFRQTLNIMRNLHLLTPYNDSFQSLERVVLPKPTE